MAPGTLPHVLAAALLVLSVCPAGSPASHSLSSPTGAPAVPRHTGAPAPGHSYQMVELMPRGEWNVAGSWSGGGQDGGDDDPQVVIRSRFKKLIYDDHMLDVMASRPTGAESESTNDADDDDDFLGRPVPRVVEHSAVEDMDTSVYRQLRVYDDVLLAAARSAFSSHHPLVLSPDLVYGYLAKGVAAHVNKFPEELRGLYVNHAGKQKLVYRNDSFVRGAGARNDWLDMFGDFARQLEGKTRRGNAVVQPGLRFSTSTPLTEAHRHVLAMESMASYFDYECVTMCGISCVILEGTLDDWTRLRDVIIAQLAEINDYAESNPVARGATLRWWSPAVEVMLDRFVATYESRERGAPLSEELRRWWSALYKLRGGEESGEVATVTGWLNVFYPYIRNDARNPWVVTYFSSPRYRASLKRHVNSFFVDYPNEHYDVGPELPSDAVPQDDYPSYVSSVPFTWNYYGEEYKMKALIGYAFLGQVTNDISVYPRGTLKMFPGYAVYYQE